MWANKVTEGDFGWDHRPAQGDRVLRQMLHHAQADVMVTVTCESLWPKLGPGSTSAGVKLLSYP